MGLKIKFLAVLVGVAFFLLVLSRIKKNTFNPYHLHRFDRFFVDLCILSYFQNHSNVG
jgi:hypothetical protein